MLHILDGGENHWLNRQQFHANSLINIQLEEIEDGGKFH